MKTFKDLEFTPHPDPTIIGQRAMMHFDDDYSVSVVITEESRANQLCPWSMAVLYKSEVTSHVLTTHDGYDVVHGLTANAVTVLMEKVQAL